MDLLTTPGADKKDRPARRTLVGWRPSGFLATGQPLASRTAGPTHLLACTRYSGPEWNVVTGP